MIPFLDLKAINKRFEHQFKIAFNDVLNSGQFIGGQKITDFETEFSNFCGTKYCVGTSNGLDALTLIFRAFIELKQLKAGDEVILPAHTFIASALAVLHAGLKPVFVEPDQNTFNITATQIAAKITPNTKAIMVVHLYGQLCSMDAIVDLSKQKQLLLIEDAAQAHGAENEKGVKAGAFGDAAAFSFYPAKNLGALGDAGAVTTPHKDVANCIRTLANYGANKKYYNKNVGYNHRLDPLQAALLKIKLAQLTADNTKRIAIASRYISEIKNNKIKVPFYNNTKNHVFHLFVVLVNNRSHFQAYLRQNNIESAVHYPIPPHKQNALNFYNELSFPITERIHQTCVSLPISPVLLDLHVSEIIKVINAY